MCNCWMYYDCCCFNIIYVTLRVFKAVMCKGTEKLQKYTIFFAIDEIILLVSSTPGIFS